MSYKQDSELVILNRLDKYEGIAKTEYFETLDRLRDLTVSGASIGGSGLGSFGSTLIKLAQVFSPSTFLPIIGNPSINIPGTSYYTPISPGTGIIPGGTASFGVGPFSQYTGLPVSGSAAGFDPYSILATTGMGSLASQGFSLGGQAAGINGLDPNQWAVGGQALPLLPLVGAGLGLVSAAGFGRSSILPAAGLISGLGGIFSSLAPFFKPGSILPIISSAGVANGTAGAIASSYDAVASRILANADVTLSNKIKNLETVLKQFDAQKEVVKKLLKDSLEGAKKSIQDL
jgi:hypothetical protein